MDTTAALNLSALIVILLLCSDALKISIDENEEICLTKQNKTGLMLHVMEMKKLLLDVKSGMTKMSNEILQVKKQLKECKTDIVYESCLHALKIIRHAPNGVYRIKTNTSNGYTKVYCHMTTLHGCSGGGWTMIMKINGKKETFSYSSSFWSNKKSYSSGDGQTGLNAKETKLPTYWSTPFNQLCVGMKIASSLQFIPITYKANSLYEIIASGKLHSTVIPRKTWKSLYSKSSLQTNCGLQGFNVHPNDNIHFRVRIGIIGNQENDCHTPDSFIGFGANRVNRPTHCGKKRGVNSCGNSAFCSTQNGDKEVQAIGYIFVR